MKLNRAVLSQIKEDTLNQVITQPKPADLDHDLFITLCYVRAISRIMNIDIDYEEPRNYTGSIEEL